MSTRSVPSADESHRELNEALKMNKMESSEIDEVSTKHNGFANPLSVKRVSFSNSTDVSIPLEEISTRNNKITAQRSSISLTEFKLIHYRLGVAFGICCIVVLFMLPVIFYYVEDGSELSDDLPTEIINISQSTFCNETVIPNCSDDLVYTYEALRLTSHFPFCINKVTDRLNELQNHSNDSAYLKSIMCQEIRQQYCTAEWRILELNGSEELINCTDYGETAPLNCSDPFGLASNGLVCLPLCDKFSQFSKTFTDFFPFWLAIFSALNVIGGIISLVVSVYKIKKLFHYPQILLVINCILISILSLFILVSTFPVENWKPLCSKKFVFDAFNEPSVFCEIQGFVYITIISLYCYFWFLYTLHLFLRVANPIRMVKLEQSKYSRLIHVIEVAIAVLIGTVPYIFFAVNMNFHIAGFPPHYCATGPVHFFYGTILPTVLASCASLIMMLFMLYKIHIHKGILRSDGSSRYCCVKFSTPEVKIFLTFCYLLIVMVLLWTSTSIQISRFDATVSAIRTYAQCMSGGIREGLDCEPYRRDVEAHTNPVLLTVYFTLFSFLSYSNLPFLIQFQTFKFFVVKTAKRLSYKRSASSTAL